MARFDCQLPGDLPNPLSGGEGGIRTHGALARPTVFETATFNHSVTSPLAASYCPAALGRTPE